MPARIETTLVSCVGGLITSLDALTHATDHPGSATTLINMEPSNTGGYRRINGYAKWDTHIVPQTGDILGVGILNEYVVACRGTGVYRSTGNGWTLISTDTRTNTGTPYRFVRYNLTGVEKIGFVDGANRPATMDSTGVYSILSNAPNASTSIAPFASRLWLATGNLLTYSAANTDNDFTPASGAGVINVGDTITNLFPWRENLIIFCRNRILRVTGTSPANFQVLSITANLGCAWPDTIQEIGGDIVFYTADGIRTLGGTQKFNDWNLSSLAKNVNNPILDLSTDFNKLYSVTIRSKGQYRVYGSSTTVDSASCRGYLGTPYPDNVDNVSDWQWGELQGVKVLVATSTVAADKTEHVIFGNTTGYIYNLDTGSSFDGGDIFASYITPYLVFKEPSARKVFRKLVTYLKVTGAYRISTNLTLDYGAANIPQPSAQLVISNDGAFAIYDDSMTLYDTMLYSGNVTPTEIISLVGSGFAGSFSFTSNGVLPSYTISSLTVSFTTEGHT